jgi:cell division protein FtsW
MRTWIQRNLKGDPVIWGIVFCLSVISILVVYSATGSLAFKRMGGNTEYYLLKHGGLVALSLMVMWVAHKIDYRYYSKLARLSLWLSVPLLIATWRFGVTLNDAYRWVTIPLINLSFQPSDFAKLALIAGIAAYLSKRQSTIRENKEAFLHVLAWAASICGLIALANLSTAILLFCTSVLVMFIGRVPSRYLAMMFVAGIMAVSVALMVGQRKDTAISRVNSFLYSEEVPYQAEQAYIAVATGGVLGKGPGNSEQRNFLPHPYSDFIFAIIIEEYGMLGALVVIFLYLALLYRGMLAVSKSNRAFGGLLSAGLSFMIVLQAMVNMAVTVGLGPITGLNLPMISMGGTSLLFTGLALGIILSVSRGDLDELPATASTVRKSKLQPALS